MIGIILTIVFNGLLFLALMQMAGYYDGYKFSKNWRDEIKSIKEALYYSEFWQYLLWALIQQIIVIIVYWVLFYYVTPDKLYCVAIAAMIMGLIHFPNLVLLFAVFGMEYFLLSMFSKFGIVYLPFMVFTHAFLASALLKFYPEAVTKGFRVLWSFWKVYKK
jgi:uncharacterized membrane protein